MSQEAHLPIVQYWDAGEPPSYLREPLASFETLNPDLPHRLFDRSTAGEFIAAHCTERELAAFHSCAVPSMQSDYLRYCALLAGGGVYADVDFLCKRALHPLLDGSATGQLFGYPTKVSVGDSQVHVVQSGFMAFRASGHPLLRLALDVATAQIEQRIAEDVWVTAGPGVLTGLHALYLLEDLDDYGRLVAGTKLEPTASILPAIAGARDRVVEAFDDVELHPVAERRKWVAGVGGEMAYKTTDSHWVAWEAGPRSIFT